MFAFLLILLFIIAVVVIIDWIPLLHAWQSRIKIGQFSGFEEWKSKVADVASQWLRRTPTIKVTDNTRVIIIDMIRGNYKRTSIQSWQQGALLLGLSQYVNQTGDGRVRKEIAGFVHARVDDQGNWKTPLQEVDEILLAYAISKTPDFNNIKTRPALDAAYQLLQNAIGSDGTIQYRRHYPNYRLVDTIGFVCPFLIRYGLQNNRPEAIQLGLNQLREFNKYAMFDSAFLPCHSYDIDSHLPVGLFGWGRGLGWYAIGLMDSWLELPDEHAAKNELTQMILQLARTVLRFQNQNGSWSWIIMSKEKQNDSSATAILSWFLAHASAIPEISQECHAGYEKALQYLKQVTRRNGAIDFSQGDTKGVGVYSQKFDILPFTQGFCLRALYTNSKTNS